MKAKPIKKLIFLALSIILGIWVYMHPFPTWLSNFIIAVITTGGINRQLHKLLEDESNTK
jgi:hypothetical protein